MNVVGCPKKPISHGNAMSLTRDAVLFKSTVHGPNSQVGSQISGLPDSPLHARRSSSPPIASAICPTSPRGDRLQLPGHRKGTKTKKLRDSTPTAEIVGVVCLFCFVVVSGSLYRRVGPTADWNLRAAQGRGGADKATPFHATACHFTRGCVR